MESSDRPSGPSKGGGWGRKGRHRSSASSSAAQQPQEQLQWVAEGPSQGEIPDHLKPPPLGPPPGLEMVPPPGKGQGCDPRRGGGGGGGAVGVSSSSPSISSPANTRKTSPGAGGSGVSHRPSDQDVLISFMRLLRQGNVAAQDAHAQYLKDKDESAFLATARALLEASNSSPLQPAPASHGASGPQTAVERAPSGSAVLQASSSSEVASKEEAGTATSAKSTSRRRNKTKGDVGGGGVVASLGVSRVEVQQGIGTGSPSLLPVENKENSGGKDALFQGAAVERKANDSKAPGPASATLLEAVKPALLPSTAIEGSSELFADKGEKSKRSRSRRTRKGQANGHDDANGDSEDPLHQADAPATTGEALATPVTPSSATAVVDAAPAPVLFTATEQVGEPRAFVTQSSTPPLQPPPSVPLSELATGLSALVLEAGTAKVDNATTAELPFSPEQQQGSVGPSGRLAELLNSSSSPFSIGLGLKSPMEAIIAPPESSLGHAPQDASHVRSEPAPIGPARSPHQTPSVSSSDSVVATNGSEAGDNSMPFVTAPSDMTMPHTTAAVPPPGSAGQQPPIQQLQQQQQQHHEQQRQQQGLIMQGQPPMYGSGPMPPSLMFPHGFVPPHQQMGNHPPQDQLFQGGVPHHPSQLGFPPQPYPPQSFLTGPDMDNARRNAMGNSPPQGPIPPPGYPFNAQHQQAPPQQQQVPGGPPGPAPPNFFQQQHQHPGGPHPPAYPGPPPQFFYPPMMQFGGWHPAMGPPPRGLPMPAPGAPFPPHHPLSSHPMPPGFQPDANNSNGSGSNGPAMNCNVVAPDFQTKDSQPEGGQPLQQQQPQPALVNGSGDITWEGNEKPLQQVDITSSQQPPQQQQQQPPQQEATPANAGLSIMAQLLQHRPVQQQPQPEEAQQQQQALAVKAIPPPTEGLGGDGNGDQVAAGAGGGTEKKEVKPKRTTKGQEARLWVLSPDGVAERYMVRPKADLHVRWEMPRQTLQSLAKPELGLFRIGVASNLNAVITKPMQPPQANYGRESPFVKGSVTFYAPRSAGVFVFRVFDAEDPIATHGTSRALTVDVQERDVEPALRFVLQQFKEKRTTVPALSQLAIMLRALRPFQPGRQFSQLLSSAIHLTIKQVDPSAPPNDDLSERNKVMIQANVAQVLRAIFCSRFVPAFLDDNLRSELKAVAVRYCSLTEEFFPSDQDKKAWYANTWGFQPKGNPITALPQPLSLQLSNEVDILFPSLLPSESFIERREELRERLEAGISDMQMEGVIPQGTKLRVFGSSANNFGNDEADLDMCLTFPKGVAPMQHSPADIIEKLALQLQALGMTEVNPRPTARIPIVLFKDPNTGLDCDISLENPLALRNTQLLKVYSRVDPRVRQLAFVVKYWARRRRINNASEGTLSSYAYILLILHFLQTRRPAIVPNLQHLPPDWTGQDVDFSQIRALLLPVMVQHPIEKTEVDTYFYVPPQGDFRVLNQFALRNKTGVGALLMEFFRYYAWDVDYREHVVSVRTGQLLKKDDKAELDCWPANSRLAVEDPFETWYNVTHFLREGKHRQVRMEFARAYTMCCDEGQKISSGGPIPTDLLARICEEAPEPPQHEDKEEELEGDGQQQPPATEVEGGGLETA